MAKKRAAKESDDSYFLKLLVFFVLGTVWFKFNGYIVFPAGLILGVILIHRDHLVIDRKVEYAMLLVAAIIGLTGWGLYFPL